MIFKPLIKHIKSLCCNNKETLQDFKSIKVDFLMPCHSTPYYSHFHWSKNRLEHYGYEHFEKLPELRTLECSPRFNKKGEIVGTGFNKYSQHRQFLRQPIHFIYKLYNKHHNLTVPESTNIIWGENHLKEIDEYRSRDELLLDQDSSPLSSSSSLFNVSHSWDIPTYLIFYDNLLPHLQPFLDYFKFVQIDKVFHSHMEEHYIVLYFRSKKQ